MFQTSGEAARDAAIDRVKAAAPLPWVRTALAVVRQVASRGEAFTADEVWVRLEDMDVGPPPEPRAMGAVFRQAVREGYVVATDRVRPTGRVRAHRRPVRVWMPGPAVKKDGDG